jgi:outer membrane protein assembly factor BamB
VWTVFVIASLAAAQDAAHRVRVPADNPQVANRLRAVERVAPAVRRPETPARCVALAGLAPLAAVAPVVAERRPDEWDQLGEEYYALLLAAGEALVTPDATDAPAVSVQVRRLCHQRIASLPRTVRAAYRQRVDADAKRLLDRGRADRDPAPLRRLVDEAFCSSHGDEALDLLGDLAFARGDFEEARAWWGLLVADPSDAPGLHFPDPTVDITRVRAKRILALAFLGQVDDAWHALGPFRRDHPAAAGHLAGRDGNYARTLQAALQTLVKDGITNNDATWPTFAGSPSRNRVLTAGPPGRLWEDGPTWSVKLPSLEPAKTARTGDPPPDRVAPTWRVAFHPVIAGRQVLIADARSVRSYDLRTGQPLFQYDLQAAGLVADGGAGVDPRALRPRFTLTVAGDRAYVRLGRQALAPPAKDRDRDAAPSFLVCLSLVDPGAAKRPREVWHVKAQAEDGRPAFFEGSPLVRDGRAYIAQSRVVGKRVVTALACYDALGRLRWQRDVCDCPEFEDSAKPRFRQHLLTSAGSQLVYCSHAGAIVAADPWTGQPLWAVRYPSRGPTTRDHEPSPRDLAPCVYHAGRVYAAPLDSDRVFCLDAATGRVRWERDGLEVVHLLGVAEGRLLLTTRPGMQAIRADTGAIDWVQPSDGRLPPLGRGLVAGGWVFWPTRDPHLPLRAIAPTDGRQARGDDRLFDEPTLFDPTQLRRIPPGNIAFGEGCLVVAGTDELVGFVPAELQPVPPAAPKPAPRVLYQAARIRHGRGEILTAAHTLLRILSLTKDDPRAALWRELVVARLEALARPAARAPLAEWRAAFATADCPAGVRAVAWKCRIESETDAAAARALAREFAGDAEALGAWYLGPDDVPLSARAWLARRRGSAPPAGHVTRATPVVRVAGAGAADAKSGPRWETFAGRLLPVAAPDGGEDVVLAALGPTVTCLDPATGARRWTRRLDFEPAWCGRHRDLVVLAGADGVTAVRLDDGTPVWSFPAPSRWHRAYSLTRDGPALVAHTDGLAGFHIAGGRLICLHDQRRFIALDLATGEVGWQRAAPSAALRPLDGGVFQPHFLVRQGDVLAQDAHAARVWLTGGRVVERAENPWPRAWEQPPLAQASCIYVTAQAGRVVCLDAKTRRPRWTFEPAWPTSLTGAPAVLFGNGRVVLALVPRNQGHELVCLDPRDGGVTWRLPPDTFRTAPDRTAVALDEKAVYAARRDGLEARSLNDGRLLWRQALPAAGAPWRLLYAAGTLIAYPEPRPVDAALARTPFAALRDIPASAFSGRASAGVVLVAAADGRVLDRLAVPEGVDGMRVVGDSLVVSAGGVVRSFGRVK